MSKKYRLEPDPATGLNRVVALRDFGNVLAGSIGGLIESEKNLSQQHNAWVHNNAKVYGNAEVYGNAKVYGNALVSGNDSVCEYTVCTGRESDE